MNLLEYAIARHYAQLREKPELTAREKARMDILVPAVKRYEANEIAGGGQSPSSPRSGTRAAIGSGSSRSTTE